MEREEAITKVRELRERKEFFAPFNATDKSEIEKLYKAVLGKDFIPTTCQNCYHDAVIELYLYLIKNNGTMAEKCNYRLKAGAIINSPSFDGGKIYTNDNLTDAVAAAFLKKFPKQQFLFQKVPTKAKVSGKGAKGNPTKADGAGEVEEQK